MKNVWHCELTEVRLGLVQNLGMGRMAFLFLYFSIELFFFVLSVPMDSIIVGSNFIFPS